MFCPRGRTMTPGRRIGLVVFVVSLTACAGSHPALRAQGLPAGDVTTPRTVHGGEFHVLGSTTGGGDAYDAAMLFDRANGLARQQQCEPAVADYDRLLREFQGSTYTALADYDRGLCLQQLQRLPDAAAAMRTTVTAARDPDLSRTAEFRLAVLGEQAQQPAWVLEATAELLARTDISRTDRVEALARRAAALLATGHRDEAVAAANEAVTVAPTPEAITALGDDTYAAEAKFLLAEATREQGATVVYTVGAADAEEAILRRVTLVTHAHVQFNEAIRVGNPHWAAAAGFRIGEMYRDLYEAIVHAPTPGDWDDHAREVYQRRTAERLRPLLQGALRAWEATMAMAQRTGIADNAWVHRAADALDNLRALILGGGSATPRTGT